jgi:hypothetical protein
MNVHSLRQQVERLGLTCTVQYLLPMLFTEEKVPTEVLRGCQTAVGVRQTVVHKGQRDVDPARTRHYLESIRTLCGILKAYEDTGADEGQD